ncbi:hypothetical protein IYQ92_03195 [Streptococcus sp. HF-1907]|nr:hypothetical protein [Streptococcus sp. HF-1907]
MKWFRNFINKLYYRKLMKKHKGILVNGIGVIRIFDQTIIFHCNSFERNINFRGSNTIRMDATELHLEVNNHEQATKEKTP